VRDEKLWKDMKFSLTYDGELLSASDKHNRLPNKNRIRFEIADQLWPLYCQADFSRFQLDHESIPNAGVGFQGIAFAPILTRKMNAACRLNIRFMRSEHPGSISHGGDLDNRLKTLLDALRLPQAETEVLPALAPRRFLEPQEGEKVADVCLCLLEDDALVTELAIETVMLMKPLPRNHVRLVMDVEFRPFDFL
jgi:hypothetical protein